MGDTVMMRAKEKWEPATFIGICQDKPRSYIVGTLGGKRYRRSRCHLKLTPSSWNVRLRYQNCDDWPDDASVINETNATETKCQRHKVIIPQLPFISVDLKKQSENHLGTLTQTIDHNL